MKRLQIVVGIVAVGVGLLAANVSQAGLKTSQSVQINSTSRFATGDLGYVHNTPNLVEYIGCSLTGKASGITAQCTAKNADATLSAQCSSTVPAIVQAVASLKSDSYLVFYWDAAGKCTSVSVHNNSYTQPKAP